MIRDQYGVYRGLVEGVLEEARRDDLIRCRLERLASREGRRWLNEQLVEELDRRLLPFDGALLTPLVTRQIKAKAYEAIAFVARKAAD